jgi:diguanylate cyclase (GGDEF)-like protein/PAS domain S-box-containing protein
METNSTLIRRQAESSGEERPTETAVAGDALLGAYPGPAARIDAGGMVRAANVAAAPMLAVFGARPGGLAAVAAAIRAAGGPRMQDVSVPGLATAVTLEVAMIPVGGDLVLLGRDVSLATNLRAALVDSRQRFKDLVEISSDFAWETSESGGFVFVSPQGALGWRADELLGRPVTDFVIDGPPGPGRSVTVTPFSTRAPVEQAELWMLRADGGTACLNVSAVPLVTADGKWRGARGACRDVTEARARDTALAEARNRERVFAYIVRTIRDEVEPAAMLAAAAAAIARALGALGCRIWRRTEAGEFQPAAECGAVPMVDLDPVRFGSADTEEKVVEWHDSNSQFVAALTRYRRTVNGAICLWRPGDCGQWSDTDRTLLIDLAGQLGIAQAQIAQHEALAALAHTDGLTGLLNRRSFVVELERQMAHATRTGRPGAVVYVDLDNFKPINDRLGHQRGDEVLRMLAQRLRGESRVGDLVSRLGGDEFAMWLTDTDSNGAVRKAKSLIRLADALTPYCAGSDRPLGLSVGVAVHLPNDPETAAELLARADAAMYAAKHGGKGRYAIAEGAKESKA